MGSFIFCLWPMILVALAVAAETWHLTFVRLPRENRFVNWGRVYKMELEVWGQTFEHLGAPSAIEAGGYNPFSVPTRNIENSLLTAPLWAPPEDAYMTNAQVEEVFRRGY